MHNPEVVKDYFEKEQKKLLAYVKKNSRETRGEEPEDVVQDVFLAILEGVFHPIENLAAYVYRALDNRMRDLIRRKAAGELRYEDLGEAESGVLDRILADERFNSARVFEEKEKIALLQEAIDSLPEAQKEVLVATEMDGWTFEELSELWDVPLGTLLSRKHRALKNLGKKLQKLL